MAGCLCASLSDLAHIPMGDSEHRDERFLETVEEVRAFGPPKWWLYVGRCRECSQAWLVAQEERIYDEHLLAKLTPTDAASIIERNSWPKTFLTYESVLQTGRMLSNPCHFLDPMAHSLLVSVSDLRAERSDISTRDLSRLLGVTEAHVARLDAKAAREARRAAGLGLLGRSIAWGRAFWRPG